MWTDLEGPAGEADDQDLGCYRSASIRVPIELHREVCSECAQPATRTPILEGARVLCNLIHVTLVLECLPMRTGRSSPCG